VHDAHPTTGRAVAGASVDPTSVYLALRLGH
jgi:hypothetical protein